MNNENQDLPPPDPGLTQDEALNTQGGHNTVLDSTSLITPQMVEDQIQMLISAIAAANAQSSKGRSKKKKLKPTSEDPSPQSNIATEAVNGSLNPVGTGSDKMPNPNILAEEQTGFRKQQSKDGNKIEKSKSANGGSNSKSNKSLASVKKPKPAAESQAVPQHDVLEPKSRAVPKPALFELKSRAVPKPDVLAKEPTGSSNLNETKHECFQTTNGASNLNSKVGNASENIPNPHVLPMEPTGSSEPMLMDTGKIENSTSTNGASNPQSQIGNASTIDDPNPQSQAAPIPAVLAKEPTGSSKTPTTNGDETKPAIKKEEGLIVVCYINDLISVLGRGRSRRGPNAHFRVALLRGHIEKESKTPDEKKLEKSLIALISSCGLILFEEETYMWLRQIPKLKNKILSSAQDARTTAIQNGDVPKKVPDQLAIEKLAEKLPNSKKRRSFSIIRDKSVESGSSVFTQLDLNFDGFRWVREELEPITNLNQPNTISWDDEKALIKYDQFIYDFVERVKRAMSSTYKRIPRQPQDVDREDLFNRNFGEFHAMDISDLFDPGFEVESDDQLELNDSCEEDPLSAIENGEEPVIHQKNQDQGQLEAEDLSNLNQENVGEDISKGNVNRLELEHVDQLSDKGIANEPADQNQEVDENIDDISEWDLGNIFGVDIDDLFGLEPQLPHGVNYTDLQKMPAFSKKPGEHRDGQDEIPNFGASSSDGTVNPLQSESLVNVEIQMELVNGEETIEPHERQDQHLTPMKHWDYQNFAENSSNGNVILLKSQDLIDADPEPELVIGNNPMELLNSVEHSKRPYQNQKVGESSSNGTLNRMEPQCLIDANLEPEQVIGVKSNKPRKSKGQRLNPVKHSTRPDQTKKAGKRRGRNRNDNQLESNWVNWRKRRSTGLINEVDLECLQTLWTIQDEFESVESSCNGNENQLKAHEEYYDFVLALWNIEYGWKLEEREKQQARESNSNVLEFPDPIDYEAEAERVLAPIKAKEKLVEQQKRKAQKENDAERNENVNQLGKFKKNDSKAPSKETNWQMPLPTKSLEGTSAQGEPKQSNSSGTSKRKAPEGDEEETVVVKKSKNVPQQEEDSQTEMTGRQRALRAVQIALNWTTPECAVEEAIDKMILDGDFEVKGNQPVITAFDQLGIRMAVHANSILINRGVTVKDVKFFVPQAIEKDITPMNLSSDICLARPNDNKMKDPLLAPVHEKRVITRMKNYVEAIDSRNTKWLFLCSPGSEHLLYEAKPPLTELQKENFKLDAEFVNPIQRRVINNCLSGMRKGIISKRVKSGTFKVLVGHQEPDNEANALTGEPIDIFDIENDPSIATVMKELEPYMENKDKDIVNMLRNSRDNIHPKNLLHAYGVLSDNLQLLPKVASPFDEKYVVNIVEEPPKLTPKQFGEEIADVLLTKGCTPWQYSSKSVFIFNGKFEGNGGPNQEAVLACLVALKSKPTTFDFVFLTFGMEGGNGDEQPVGAIITHEDIDHPDANDAALYLENGQFSAFWKKFKGGDNILLGKRYGSKMNHFQMLVIEKKRKEPDVRRAKN